MPATQNIVELGVNRRHRLEGYVHILRLDWTHDVRQGEN